MSNKTQVSDEYLEELYFDVYDTPILDLYEELKELELLPDTSFWCKQDNGKILDFKNSLIYPNWYKMIGYKIERLKLFYFIKCKNELELVNKLIYEYSFYFKKYFNQLQYSQFTFRSRYDSNQKDYNPYYIEWNCYSYKKNSLTIEKTYMDTLFSEIGKSYCNDSNFFKNIKNRKNKKTQTKTKKVIKNSETKEFVYDYEEVWDLHEKHMEYILSIREVLTSIGCKLLFIDYSYNSRDESDSLINDLLIYHLELTYDVFEKFKGLILDDWLSVSYE